MGVWDSLSSLASEGLDSVEGMLGMGDTPQQAGQIASTVPLTPAQGGAGMTAANAGQAGMSEGGALDDAESWVSDALKPMMPSILGAAMRPHTGAHSAGAVTPAHAINANTSGEMAPFNEVTKMADDNPLSSIHQWSNLF